MDKTNGPKLRIDATCRGCAHCVSESYQVQGDSGFEVYCTITPERRRIGDTSWDTPEWCPLLDGAMKRLSGKLAQLHTRAGTASEADASADAETEPTCPSCGGPAERVVEQAPLKWGTWPEVEVEHRLVRCSADCGDFYEPDEMDRATFKALQLLLRDHAVPRDPAQPASYPMRGPDTLWLAPGLRVQIARHPADDANERRIRVRFGDHTFWSETVYGAYDAAADAFAPLAGQLTESASAAGVHARTERPIEIRLDETDDVDEVLGTGFLHMERLDDDVWWFGLYPDGTAAGRPRLAWTICCNTCTITEYDGLELGQAILDALRAAELRPEPTPVRCSDGDGCLDPRACQARGACTIDEPEDGSAGETDPGVESR